MIGPGVIVGDAVAVGGANVGVNVELPPTELKIIGFGAFVELTVGLFGVGWSGLNVG